MINLEVRKFKTKYISWRKLLNGDRQLVIQTDLGMILIEFTEEQYQELLENKEYKLVRG